MIEGSKDPGGRVFPPTRYSLIERLQSVEADVRAIAFDDVVGVYWKPVYKHLRIKWRLAPEDAEDLTQAFFLGALERGWLEEYEAGKARFRTFVRLCADRFVMNQQQAAGRQKRGGTAQRISLDFPGAEQELARAGAATPPEAEDFFRLEFVRALFQRAVSAVRQECDRDKRAVAFQLFERYDLDPPDDVSYAGLAEEFGLTSAQVTNHLAFVRRRFRQHALDALRSLSGSPEHFREDARAIFGIEVE